ncbi:MAG: hypothetical protein Q8O13_05395 [Candidatus Omnitrophota bacterium]|nr:hypothetical protein [Candidatus Omnitrophota bacterium]
MINKNFKNKGFLVIGGILFFLILINPAFASVDDFLVELGKKYYANKDYSEAGHEFNKALILNPDNKEAVKYLNLIKEKIEPASQQISKAPLKKEPEEIKTEPEIPKIEKRQEAIERALEEQKPEITIHPKPQTQEKDKYLFRQAKIAGETKMGIGVTSTDGYWKRANFDLNEREWRLNNNTALNNRLNTYDPAIYDRLRVDIDTLSKAGFGFHSNITVDPWSFTGKSDKINITGSGGDTAEVQLLYWSNTGYTVNQTVSSSRLGFFFDLPEIKVEDGRISQTKITKDRTGTIRSFTIPETKINRFFWPVREFWFDYKPNETVGLRVFPMAYQDEALTSDDPLQLSNHHIWWEESPWLDSWKPGTFNNGVIPPDFTKGEWDDSLSFFTRDSDGTRLTALRGGSFNWSPSDETTLTATVATPKTLWQNYERVDSIPGALRFKQGISDNLDIGTIYTLRYGYNKSEVDAKNQVAGFDVAFAPIAGFKISAQTAHSSSEWDKTSEYTSGDYKTSNKGDAYFVSLLSDFSGEDILDTNYHQLKPKEEQQKFFKLRLYAAQLDEAFDPQLSTYRETRDDTYWGRHIHFKRPFDYYSTGVLTSPLSYDDIAPFRIGDGIDKDRNTIGMRIETSLFKGNVQGLLDSRNVHRTGGEYVETVSRTEWMYKIAPFLTSKFLYLNHDLPKTTANKDPLIFDTDSDIPYRNDSIIGGEDPSLNTLSFGLEYQPREWLSLDGIYEHTNDSTVAYDNFPRDIFQDFNVYHYGYEGVRWRKKEFFVSDQSLFPLPPYEYEQILRGGIRLTPIEKKLDIYLNYTHSGFEFAGPIDDNMNHFGLELTYMPTDTLGFAFDYTYAKFWDDLTSRDMAWHHNFFTQARKKFSKTDELVFEYGVGSYTPFGTATSDPLGGGTLTLDTQHLFRIFYNRKF